MYATDLSIMIGARVCTVYAVDRTLETMEEGEGVVGLHVLIACISLYFHQRRFSQVEIIWLRDKQSRIKTRQDWYIFNSGDFLGLFQSSIVYELYYGNL